MSKLLTIILIAVFVYYGNNWSDDSHDCRVLLGSWEGEYLYPNGVQNSWKITFLPHSGFDVEMHSKKESESTTSKLIGIWHCHGDVLMTTVREWEGEAMTLRHQILELTPTVFKYQLLLENGLGPTYVSKKITDTHNNSLKPGTPQSGAH